MHFKKSIIALTLASTLAACGGSSSSDTPTAAAPLNINGTASKGLILGGTVTAYLINDDGTKGTTVGTATTDTTDGTYELTLDAGNNGKALIVEITATDGSQMKCDLSVCLADDDPEIAITFGELYPLPSDFELSAVSSGSDSGTIDINITPLTNIAAALALDKVEGGANPAAAAEAANYQIADLLGLDGDVTELPIVDLTEADAINGADADALEANLISAAVVEAALNNSVDGTSLEDALDSFVTQYVASNGIADTEGDGVDTSSVSLEEIAAASQTLTGTMVTEVEGVSAEDDNIAAVETALISAETEAAAGSTEPTQGDVPDDIGSEGLLATKAFVSQVSTLNVATQIDGAKAFEEQISLASDLASDDLDANAEALSLATEAIAAAVVANQAAIALKEPITSFVHSTLNDKIVVAIGTNGEQVTYTVDQSLDIVDFNYDTGENVTTATTIKLVAAIADYSNTIVESETDDKTNNIYTWTSKGEASLDLTLSGSVSTEQVSITINDGSHVIATLTDDEKEEDEYTYTEGPIEGGSSTTRTEGYTAVGSISVTGVDINLSATIAQLASTEITDPIKFTGDFKIEASLLSVAFDETDQYEQSSSSSQTYDESTGVTSYTNTWDSSSTDAGTEIINIDDLTVSLSGIFSNSTKSLEAVMAITASGIKETCVWEGEWSYSNTNLDGVNTSSNNNHYNNDDCNLTDETAETYASASINVRMTLDVDGIDNDVNLEAAIQRTGLEDGIASIDLTYGGNQLDFDFNSDDIVEVEGETVNSTTITATLTNHNGVTLTATNILTDDAINNDNDTSVITGVITHEGEEFATVSDEGIVTFSDGTFVSL